MDGRTHGAVDTIVIGAGQAGLSAGITSRKRGLPFAILDADARIGDHWRDRWDSLRLYSPARYDSLPGMRFPAPSSHWPTLARWPTTSRRTRDGSTARPERDACRSSRADRRRLRRVDRGRWAPRGTPGHRRDRAVPAAQLPAFAIELDPSIRQLHSHEYRNPAQLRPGRGPRRRPVAFRRRHRVRGRQRGHRTILSGKSHGQLPIRVTDTKRAMLGWPVVEFVFGTRPHDAHADGPADAPGGPQGRRPAHPRPPGDLDRAGVERHDAKTVGVRDGRPVLADGTVLDVANVIWATGYRPDYSFIAAPVVGEDGWPIEERGVSPTVPGLYFLGVPFQYAFSSMLVAGAGRDAEYVVEQVLGETAVGHPRRAPSSRLRRSASQSVFSVRAVGVDPVSGRTRSTSANRCAARCAWLMVPTSLPWPSTTGIAFDEGGPKREVRCLARRP